jgi:hypothetical protein
VKDALQKKLGDDVIVSPAADTLKVYHGQVLEVTLEAGDPAALYRYVSGAGSANDQEVQWTPLRNLLPATQGGLLATTNWEALENHLLRPMQDGPILPEFTLEGPLDLYFANPSAVQMWLPHAVEPPGQLKRIMLRRGAALTVRGARSASLRPVALPAVSTSDFAAFATEDSTRHSAMGLMHLAVGLRQQAELRWNGSAGQGISPALVALELRMSESGGALLAAPAERSGVLRRLRARSQGSGIVEIMSRDVEEAGASVDTMSAKESKALALAAASPYVWPLREAHPDTVNDYERLLREVLAGHIFSNGARTSKPSTESSLGSGPRFASDVPLKLHRSSAEALFLVSMDLDVLKNTHPKVTQGGSQVIDGASDLKAGSSEVELPDKAPTSEELLMQMMTGTGRRRGAEVWNIVAKIEGNAAVGVRVKPLVVKQVEVGRDTVTLAEDALLHVFNSSLPA